MFADMSLNFKHTVYDTFAQLQDIVLLTNSYRSVNNILVYCFALGSKQQFGSRSEVIWWKGKLSFFFITVIGVESSWMRITLLVLGKTSFTNQRVGICLSLLTVKVILFDRLVTDDQQRTLLSKCLSLSS